MFLSVGEYRKVIKLENRYLSSESNALTGSLLKPPPKKKQDRILSEGPTRHPPQCFLYLRETTSWCCEGEEGEEKVHLLTHTTTRDVVKNS